MDKEKKRNTSGIYKTEICPHCGTEIKWYKHHLNNTLLKGLNCLANAGGTVKASKLRDLIAPNAMTNTMYTNFQKLRYFGLVSKAPENNRIYILTDKGRDFLNGKCTAPSYVITRNAEVMITGPGIYITEVRVPMQGRTDFQSQASMSLND